MTEKEAIEIIKGLYIGEYEWYEKTKQIDGHEEEEAEKVRLAIDTIINLLEKQQKEIEKLKEPKYLLNAETGELKVLNNDFISKDKIKTKIEDCRFLLHSFEKDRDEKLVCDGEESINCLLGQISILNSLLEEK